MFAGDILGINVVRPWEFNSTFPLRSILPIYLGTAIPLLVLKSFSAVCGYTISWYAVTVAVRLMMTFLSLVADYAAMQLAQWSRQPGTYSSAVIVATSYLSLVFYTRTFSNTMESFLFAALLCVVTRKALQPASHIPCTFVISMLIVVGIFNRPTFIFYAVVPYLWWLFSDGTHNAVAKAVNSMLTALSVCILLVVFDSTYFGRLDIGNLSVADLADLASFLSCNLTATPLNFVLYNVQSGNLAEHGLHPRVTHVAVNMPLLFNVLCVSFYYDAYWWLFVATGSRTQKLVSMYHRAVMLVILCVVPMILLSLFPHQEPRFLIPLLPVLAALYAASVARNCVVMAPLWVVANLVGCLFYGCIHQAGVLPCLGYLQQTRLTTVDRHVFFWHTYTAPRHPLLQPKDSVSTTVTSLEGKPVEDLIHSLKLVGGAEFRTPLEKPEVMVAASSSEHHFLVGKAADAGVRLDVCQSFWPHLSMEYPPTVDSIMCYAASDRDHATKVDSDGDGFCNKTLVERIVLLTSLNLYRVTFL